MTTLCVQTYASKLHNWWPGENTAKLPFTAQLKQIATSANYKQNSHRSLIETMEVYNYRWHPLRRSRNLKHPQILEPIILDGVWGDDSLRYRILNWFWHLIFWRTDPFCNWFLSQLVFWSIGPQSNDTPIPTESNLKTIFLCFLETRPIWQLVPQSIGPHSKITFKLFPLNQTWKWHLKTVFLCRDPLERIHCRFLENLDNHSRPLPPRTSPLCRWGPTGHSLSYSICHFYHFHIFCQPTISDTTRISLKVDFLMGFYLMIFNGSWSTQRHTILINH